MSLDPTVICNPKPVFPLDKGIGPSIIKVTPFGIIKFSIILKVEVVPTVGSSCITPSVSTDMTVEYMVFS